MTKTITITVKPDSSITNGGHWTVALWHVGDYPVGTFHASTREDALMFAQWMAHGRMGTVVTDDNMDLERIMSIGAIIVEQVREDLSLLDAHNVHYVIAKYTCWDPTQWSDAEVQVVEEPKRHLTPEMRGQIKAYLDRNPDALDDMADPTLVETTVAAELGIEDGLVAEYFKPNTSYEDAQRRVRSMGFSEDEQEFIFSDWPNWDEHLEWVLTAPKHEIQNWINASK